nr:aspartic proteinase PCS1-like [Tanacetum cinerariifolium]
MTRWMLPHCDSTWDLYPVRQPSPIPQAFLTSQHTWHQRLRHSRSEVLRRLTSRNFISCNKKKTLVLYHACQLRTHMSLPFQIITSLHQEFSMTDLVALNYFQGISVTRDSSRMFLSQPLSRSSAEAEYRDVANAIAETCWLQNLLRELHTPLSSATLVYCDNVSVVYLSSNPVQHQRTKHIVIDIHFVRDLVVAVEGNLAIDTFRFENTGHPGIVFGCMDTLSSSNQDEDKKTAGLLGMNRGSLSFVSQMGFPKFSVAYTVQLEGVKVGGVVLSLPKSVYVPDHTGAGQTMVDSGTQYTFLLGPVYTALRNEFLKQTKSVLKVYEDSDYVFQGAMDLCYRVDRTRVGLPVLPSVTLMFRGAEMSISGERLLVQVSGLVKGNDKIHCFTFGNSDLLGVEAYIIGHHHQQNMLMEFDLVNSRVGLAEVRCDVASQKLGMGI